MTDVKPNGLSSLGSKSYENIEIKMSCLKVYKEEKRLGKKLNSTLISYDSVLLIFERS